MQNCETIAILECTVCDVNVLFRRRARYRLPQERNLRANARRLLRRVIPMPHKRLRQELPPATIVSVSMCATFVSIRSTRSRHLGTVPIFVLAKMGLSPLTGRHL